MVRFGLRSAVKDPDFAGLLRVSGLTGYPGLGFAQLPRASTSPVSSRAPLRSYRRAVSKLFGGGGITPGDSTGDTQPCSSRCGVSMSFDCRGFSTGLGRWDLDSGPPRGPNRLDCGRCGPCSGALPAWRCFLTESFSFHVEP